jgi:hypothetical protein
METRKREREVYAKQNGACPEFKGAEEEGKQKKSGGGGSFVSPIQRNPFCVGNAT